jgi:quinol monooxygenase YgiN
MIHVIAAIEIAPGKREAFLEVFRKLVPQVRAESGCLEYGPTCDLATDLSAQIPLRSNVVTVVEKWQSLDALHAHMAMPHMLAWRDRVKDMLVGVQLQILEPV